MPGEYNAYAVGYREVVFLVPEAVYGVPIHPSATHGAIIQTTSFALTQERVNRADKTTSRSYNQRITHRKETAWSITAYNLPSGTNGVPPDTTDALERGFGIIKIIADQVAGAGCTITDITVGAGGGAAYVNGDGVGWVNPAGELEISFVETIAGDVVTVSPPFSAAPVSGDAIKGSVTYKPANQLGQLTITRILDNLTQVFPGCFVNEITMEFPGTDEGTITIAGMGKNEFASGVSALAAAVVATPATGDVTLTMLPGEGSRFNINTRILVSGESTNTDEVFIVTDVNGDDVVATRALAGTPASAHAIGALVGPYQPPSTTAGFPLSGTIGEFFVLGANGDPATRANSTLKLQSASLHLANNGQLRNSQFGTDSAIGFSVNKREVTFSMTLWLEKETAKLYNVAKEFRFQEICIQHGKAVGATFGAKMNSAEFNIPAIAGGGDEDVNVTIDGMALGSTAGNDELFIAYF